MAGRCSGLFHRRDPQLWRNPLSSIPAYVRKSRQPGSREDHRSAGFEALEVSGLHSNASSAVIGSNIEDAAEYFSRRCEDYILCDGTLWQVCLEPCYRIETTLLRKKKYTLFSVSLTGPCHSRYCRTFPADEYSRAVNSFRKEALNRSTQAVFSPSTRIIPVNHLTLVREPRQASKSLRNLA